jgi:hypothetical protein
MFTQFEIQPVLPPKYVDKFIAEVEFMSGDADAYSTEHWPLTNEEVLPFANFVKACEGVESEGSGGPGYGGVPGYDRWGVDFPTDVFCDSVYASLESWSIFYYDDTGAKHKVEFK